MVECHASDLVARVRFPLPAPTLCRFEPTKKSQIFVKEIKTKYITFRIPVSRSQYNYLIIIVKKSAYRVKNQCLQ